MSESASMDSPLLPRLLKKIDLSLLQREGFHPQLSPGECLLLLNVHILSSSVPFFKRLVDLGFAPEKIVIAPKPYSTIPRARRQITELGCVVVDPDKELFRPGSYDQVAEKNLEKAVAAASARCDEKIRRCILIDCGGLLTDVWWRRNAEKLETVSVQQTASGLYPLRLRSSVHRVSVATSAAKRHFEAKTIVDGVLRKLAHAGVMQPHHAVSVIGLGAIGSVLATKLSATQKTVLTYDINVNRHVPGFERQSSWQECVNRADITFGCTGHNFMHFDVDYVFHVSNEKRFVSLSSRDVEFKSLLNRYRGHVPYASFNDVRIWANKQSSHVVYNGGFPINFDRRTEWECEREISLTRAIVLLGILQGLCTSKSSGHPAAIDELAPVSQRRIVEAWLKINEAGCQDYSVSRGQFGDQRWWHLESEVKETDPVFQRGRPPTEPGHAVR